MVQLTRNEFDIVVLVASWLGGFAPVLLRRPGWTWPRAVGLGLLLTPFARLALDVVLSIDALFVFTVLEPVARAALWESVLTRLVYFLVLPGIGLLLMHEAVPGFGRGRPRDALAREGIAPRRSWSWDALRGFALFFAIAVAYLAAYGVARLVPAATAGGDESAYWRNITLPLIVLVSATAGLTEEFLFRGVLLKNLQRWMPWLVAALVQALFFGLIHSGYGTWTHVLGPFLFGLGMAWVARVLGVLPAAVLHAEVNVLFFALDVAPDYVGARGIVGLIALGGLLLALAVLAGYALWRTRADAVRMLWASLKRGFAEVPDAPREVAPLAPPR